MSEEYTAKLPTSWVDVVKSLSEGGLPQILAGPAGKAISRLVAGATDIPAAWLDARAQRIKDDTTARSTIMKAVAKASADAAVADPQLLDRALSRYISDLHRKQGNREAVAEKALEQLADEPAPSESPGPSDDWMNVFEEYAEKANSEELRQTWARVLAGEIRKPSSFSLRTLQFLSVLDKPTAEACETVLARVFDRGYVAVDEEISGELFEKMKVARLSGLIGQVDADTFCSRTTSETGVAIFSFGDDGIVARGKPNAVIRVPCVSVTVIGQQLYPIIQPKADEHAVNRLVEILQRCAEVESIQRGKVKEANGTTSAFGLQTIWNRPSAAAPAN
ncbi:DUF2806 domain-containing protein [Rhizobium sp. BR 362]|uniref:DUF2806 domain-containing protein n=1 Tax=Rhizobium sp. BR 362 TaxID=3040670 RepID=UPI002F3FA566